MATTDDPAMMLPDYTGGCISNLVAAARGHATPGWLPRIVVGAPQIVILVLDGLGWQQLETRRHVAPTLASMTGGSITSVVPSTTATALTSITTGLPPAAHEVVGYRVKVSRDEVLNVLRWTTAAGDARQSVVPTEFQTRPVFGGEAVPVVTRAEFAETGFTLAHLAGVRINGWRSPSAIPVQVGALVGSGEKFVYAYYDGVDKVAHERGFGAYYDAELRTADRLVGDILDVLPPHAILLVTADHGQVEVGDAVLPLGDDLLGDTVGVSGEGRFRWLHARPGCRDRLAANAESAFGDVAWIRTVDELDDEGWFGGRLSSAGRARLGDVALIARHAVAFSDPADTGESTLRCRHGSVTPAEMLVPLLAATGRG